jgi:hypothetical protein
MTYQSIGTIINDIKCLTPTTKVAHTGMLGGIVKAMA